MTINRQNSNLIFFLCLITGLIALFFLPVTWFDSFSLPNKKTALPNKDILSFKETIPHTPPSYLICSIDDDPDGVNNYGIYHPTDLAVTLDNLSRLGIKHLFLGTHLHWPDLEPEENNALNSFITTLDSCIISVPLRRTTSPVELPSYLEQTSISTDKINGNTKLLPKVNNLSFPPTFEIPKNTLTGFSQLESEPPSANIALLALWEDKVILSSLLLERMHHLNVSPAEIKVSLGEHILLGDTGNMIPIDDFGYYAPTTYPKEKIPHIISSHITSHKTSPVKTSSAILTAAGLKADSYRAIDQPVFQLDQLTLTPIVSESKTFLRPHFLVAIIALIAVIYLLAATYKLSVIRFLLWILLLTVFWLTVAALVARTSEYYLPCTHLIIAILTGLVAYFILKRRYKIQLEDSAGYIDFDEASNAFIKVKTSTSEALEASALRRLERRKAKKIKRRALRGRKKLRKQLPKKSPHSKEK